MNIFQTMVLERFDNENRDHKAKNDKCNYINTVNFYVENNSIKM